MSEAKSLGGKELNGRSVIEAHTAIVGEPEKPTLEQGVELVARPVGKHLGGIQGTVSRGAVSPWPCQMLNLRPSRAASASRAAPSRALMGSSETRSSRSLFGRNLISIAVST